MHIRNPRTCGACGKTKVAYWRKAGAKYGYMMNFWTVGKGSDEPKDYLASTGQTLTPDSDICNRCSLEFRDHGEGTKISSKAYITVIEAQPIARQGFAVAERRVSLEVLRRISEGEMVSVESCVLMMDDECRRENVSVGDTYKRRRAEDVIDALADILEDAYKRKFLPNDLDRLFDSDNRRTYTFLVPRMLSASYVAELDINMAYMEKELAKQKATDGGTGENEVRAAKPDQLDVIKQAGQIVNRDILMSRLNSGKRGAISSELDTNIPDTLQYVREEFPRSLLTLLAFCSGKKNLLSEAIIETTAEAATGSSTERTVEDDDCIPDSQDGQKADAVMVYFWGTAIARAVLGSRFFPPHYLKLSQMFKVRRNGDIQRRL